MILKKVHSLLLSLLLVPVLAESVVVTVNTMPEEPIDMDAVPARKNCRPCNETFNKLVACRACIRKDLAVGGGVAIHGDLAVAGNVAVAGDLAINGTAAFNGQIIAIAPPIITVDPALQANGITVFNTIQSAIDSLSIKKIVGTTIFVAPGTYVENVVVPQLFNSSGTGNNNFTITGDTRLVAGAGILQGVYWNNTANPTVPLGGGNSSTAVITGVAGGSTITVTTTLPLAANNINPDFTAPGGVVVGDRVAVRHDNGTFAIYTVTAVAPTQLTISPNLAASVSGVGSAIAIVPNVAIAPTTGVPVDWSAAGTLNGFMIQVPTGVDSGILMRVSTSRLNASGCLVFDGAVSVRSNSAFSQFLTTSSRGSTFFAATLESSRGSNNLFNFDNSLLAPASGARALNSLENQRLSFIGTRFVGNAPVLLSLSRTYGSANAAGPVEIAYTGTGTAVNIYDDSYVELINGVNFRIICNNPAGSPVGIRLTGSRWTMESTNSGTPSSILRLVGSNTTSFIGLILGGVALSISGGNVLQQPAQATINFGGTFLPASGTSYVAQVLNGSTLNVEQSPTPFFPGAGSNGFLVSSNSSLNWNGQGTAGDMLGVAGGTLFDIRDNSSLMIPAGTNRIFSNYTTMFNFTNNSEGDLSNFTATTNPGGINVSASNMSEVVISNATFNPSGANIGVQTSNGALVGRDTGPVTNNAAIPVSPAIANQLTTDAIGAYLATYASGVVSLAP